MHAAAGPFSFSMVPQSCAPTISRPSEPYSLFVFFFFFFCCCRCCCGPVPARDKWSLTLPVPTSSLGHKVIFHAGSQPQGLLVLSGERRVDTRLSPSLPPCLPFLPPALSVCLLSLFLPPPLLFFFSQLINYSVSVSHPHMNQTVSKGEGPTHIYTADKRNICVCVSLCVCVRRGEERITVLFVV